MACRVGALRYAVAKAEREGVVCGIAGMRRKLGKRSAVVVSRGLVLGREEAVTRTFVKGYTRGGLASKFEIW